jgi:LuxR family transcriptional regulator of spore coat protein
MVYLEQGDDAPHLSMRERQILERVALGRSAKEVAIELGIAHRTVERHIENARNKMRARNKTHMITKAVICGELVLGPDAPDNDERDPPPRGFLFTDGRALTNT